MNRTTRDLAWWYWLATVGLLAGGLLGWQSASLSRCCCAPFKSSILDGAPAASRRFPFRSESRTCCCWRWDLDPAAVDSPGAGDRHLGTGPGRLLPAGQDSVLGAMESRGALVGPSCTKHILFNAVGDCALWVRPAAAVARRVRTRYEMGRPLPIGRPDFSSEQHSPEPSQPTRRMRHVTDSHQ